MKVYIAQHFDLVLHVNVPRFDASLTVAEKL